MLNDGDIRANRVATYVRWSTDDQTYGTTLEVQLETCRNYILSQGWTPQDTLTFIDDGYSGGNLDRPALRRMCEVITADIIDCVVVYRLDRLARNIVDAVNLVLREWDGHTYFKSVCEPIDTTSAIGRQIFVMLAGFADWERNVIRERMMSGKIALVKKGKDPGGLRPFGYKKGKEPNSYAIEPNEALIIERIFRMYAEGLSFRHIANTLNEEKIPTRRGNKWSGAGIRYILGNPTYTGHMVYGHKTIKRQHTTENERTFRRSTDDLHSLPQQAYTIRSPHVPPIIMQELFDKVQMIKQEKADTLDAYALRRVRGKTTLLAGLAKCACGWGINANWAGANRQYRYYRCNASATGRHAPCDCRYMDMDTADAMVLKTIQETIGSAGSPHSLLEHMSSEHMRNQQRLQKEQHDIETQLVFLQQQVERVSNDYISGCLSSAAYTQAIKMLDAETLKTTIDYSKVLERYNKIAAQDSSFSEIERCIQQLSKWSDLDMATKRQVLKQLTKRITIYRASDQETTVSITYVWENGVIQDES